MKKIFSIAAIVALSMILLLAPARGFALTLIPNQPDTSAVLSWGTPTTYTDGTPLDLGGYFVYYGQASRAYTTKIDVHTTNTYTVASLSTGTWYFAVTSYNSSTAKTESAYSNEVFKYVNARIPSAPNLTIITISAS